MGNTSYRFFVIFFDSFLFLMVLVNFLIWSGAYADIISGTNTGVENTYFGFQSVQSMLNFLSNRIHADGFLGLQSFKSYVERFVNALLFGMPRFVESLNRFHNEGNNIFTFLSFIANFVFQLIQPLDALAFGTLSLACLLYYAVQVISVFWLACAGYFNVSMTPTPNMSEYMRVIGHFAV